MLFSVVLFLKTSHSANALPTVEGNGKKFNFKRVSSSSSQCNVNAAKSGFHYKCAKNEGRRKFVSTAPSLSPSLSPPLLLTLGWGGGLYTLYRPESLINCTNKLLQR